MRQSAAPPPTTSVLTVAGLAKSFGGVEAVGQGCVDEVFRECKILLGPIRWKRDDLHER